jgi:hypothetical protein
MNRIKKYLILAGSILLGMLAATSAVKADQQIPDDLVVVGSICIGLDCVNNEGFGFDTIRLKENNLRIKFMDTSGSSSFPTTDWQITVNDSLNGGANWFGIEDLDAGTTPFTILASAPNDSLYVSSNGNIGLGTTTPFVDLVIKSNNTPTLRLDQDTGAGFTAQVWDVGGNETSFFVRDFTNGSILPFRITSNAPEGSIYVAADGDIGFETTTPDGQFDVAHSADANNHAFLISPVSWVGINIDSGFEPRTLFEIQHTGGQSRFAVKSSGEVGIGTFNPSGRFDVRDTGDTLSYFNVDASGNVGIGTNSPVGRFDVQNIDGTTNLLTLSNAGKLEASEDVCLTGTTTCLSTAGGGGSSNQWDPWEIADVDDVLSFAFNGITLLTMDGTTGKLIATGDICGVNGNKCVGKIKSSKYVKDIYSAVDGADILEKVSSLPISIWSYKVDDNSVLHIGPMAEDFQATFGLNGETTDSIATVDGLGVALTSIQALNNKLKQKDIDIGQLKLEYAQMKEKLASLEAKLNRLLSIQ